MAPPALVPCLIGVCRDAFLQEISSWCTACEYMHLYRGVLSRDKFLLQRVRILAFGFRLHQSTLRDISARFVSCVLCWGKSDIFVGQLILICGHVFIIILLWFQWCRTLHLQGSRAKRAIHEGVAVRRSKSCWESIILVMFTHLILGFCGRGPYDDRHLSSDNMCIYVFDVFRGKVFYVDGLLCEIVYWCDLVLCLSV